MQPVRHARLNEKCEKENKEKKAGLRIASAERMRSGAYSQQQMFELQ